MGAFTFLYFFFNIIFLKDSCGLQIVCYIYVREDSYSNV